MKINKTLLLAGLGALLVGFTLFSTTDVSAQDDAGYWSLTSGPVTEAGLEEYYGTTHKLSYKLDSAKNTITHLRTTSYSNDEDGYIEGNFVTTFSLAPATINADETVTFQLSSNVDNNMKNYIHTNSVNVYLNDTIRFYRKSDDSSYGSDLLIQTGPDHVWSGSETVYYKISAGSKAGETMTLTAETSQGQMSSGQLVGGMTTKWTYQWVAATPTKPTVSKPGNGVVAKIKNVKGAKAKVTVKAASGISQYQIRYKVGKSKKWKTLKASSKKVYTLKVQKGKVVSVQARYINSAGKGAWGKTKKMKTDKK
ncbi:MAG: hypothetical protein J6P60_07090 [Lachnospiraceae bacterium]|nr:hypothetical protein [Lachnospiraceae bacterium]